MIKINHKRDQKYHFSPLRYPGGKTFLFPFFKGLIKRQGLADVTYVEPFAGGAGAGLALLFLEMVDRIVINDLDDAIFSFWRASIFNSDEFIKKVRSTPVTVAEWRKQKAIYSNRSRNNYFDTGFATFFLNRTNVSGILGGGPIGGLDQSGPWKIDARFNKETLSNRIQQIAAYKTRITVSKKDGIAQTNHYLTKRNGLIYLDPPYYDKGATLYLNHYKRLDHEALARRLNRNPEGLWLLTYDNNKEIKFLYRHRKVVNFSLNYNAYKSRKGREVLILSDAFTF